MPIYEYRCTHCGHEFEANVEMRQRDKTKCCWCEGKTERLVSRPAPAHWKGGAPTPKFHRRK